MGAVSEREDCPDGSKELAVLTQIRYSYEKKCIAVNCSELQPVIGFSV